MADDNTKDGNSFPINNNMDKPLPPQPQRIRHLPEWETPLHPPKRRQDESSSFFSRLPSLTIPKPAMTIAMPPVLRRPTTFTRRPSKQKKKKTVPISKQSISAPFAFSPGTTSLAGSMSMLNKEVMLGSPTGNGTLLPTHHTNARSPQTLNSTTTLTTGWSPPSTPLQCPHNHHQPIDEKTITDTTTTEPQSPLLKSLSSLTSGNWHLLSLNLRLPTSLNTLLSKTPPQREKEIPSPSPPQTPQTPPKRPSTLLNFPLKRKTLLTIILPLSTLLLLSLILGLSLGLHPHPQNSPPTPNPSTLPLPWNPPPLNGSYSGDLTFYHVGPGVCGFNNTDADYVCAVGHEVYDVARGADSNPNGNPLCGRRIRVWREGDSEEEDIAYSGGVVVTVVDRCTGCEGADLDLSPGVFAAFWEEGVEEGRIRGRWVWL